MAKASQVILRRLSKTLEKYLKYYLEARVTEMSPRIT